MTTVKWRVKDRSRGSRGRDSRGMQIGRGRVFGPVTRRLIQDYSALVDCDFADHYRR